MVAPVTFIRRALRRFAKARDGATAIEFGFVAVPFFMLMIGVAEVSMVGFMQTTLNTAVSDRAREIRTGQAQENGVTYDEIQDAICQDVNFLLQVDCEANLFLDVRTFPSFIDAADNLANPVVNGQLDPSGFGFDPGASSEIVVVRAYYRWRVMTPMFQAIFANAGNGDRLLVSTMMFRNEPF
jgi:Flp pilus assembly protein TadG